ncbi:zinc finger BED domain-containing protein 4-like [Myzus persicae]|uniref:zinc finger BED domain-containing protein 4-like n=1 Tax=Myzus persicae TaxID=13164 RepID=UPI000B937578|nr:zinc finger BED domain-containing protein 4-like [Myzus persicae]
MSCGNGNVDNPSSVTQIVNAESIVVEKNKSRNSCQETVENEIPILKTNPFKRKQLAITNFIPKKISVDSQKKIDNAFIQLFTKDLQPFSVVDDIGFKDFVNLLNPSYKIPNRHAISKTLILEAYEKCFNEVKEIISNDLEMACMTTDCWTSRNTENYIAITNFKNKIVLAVSDNADNVQNALSTLQLKHFGCFAHTLNLIVQSAINKESELINKNNGIKEPKKCCKTFLHPGFYMLERFMELETSVRGTIGLLDKAPNGLNPNEWAVIKEFCKVLLPFEEATRAVSGGQYITASMVIVIAQGLQDVCQQ